VPRDTDQIYDEWLIARIRCGEQAALEQLVRRWHPRWLAFALRRVGRDDIARDVVQESAIAICRGIQHLDDGAAFRAWAYRIVARRAADALRARSRIQRVEAAPHPAPAQPDAETAHAESDAILRAVERLDEDHREVVRLFYGADLSIDDIARVLAIRPGTVKSRLHAARARVRDLLEGELS